MKFKLKNVKRKQALVTLALISWLAKPVKGSVKCANSQVTLNGECVDCNALFFGCTQCSFRSDSISSLQCDTCDFGYYLLSVSSRGSSKNLVAFPQENQVSMCVEDCSTFSYNYASNPDTRKCEYCGPTCTLCSAKYGCLNDYLWDRGYKPVGEDEYPAGIFPFSSKAPSEEFQTTQACKDARCDKCTTLDAVSNRCDSCYTYVNLYNTTQQASLKCALCDSPKDVNCLNCNSTNPDLCVSCKTDHYLNTTLILPAKNCTKQCITTQTTLCTKCNPNYTQANGCKRCNTTSCLECLPGYYEVIESPGNMTCKACDLTEFNSRYTLEPTRCTQCVTEPNTCLYCDVGFLRILPDSGKPSCELKCEEGQYPYPSVRFKDKSNISTNLLDCLTCNKSCRSCMGPGEDQCLSCPPLMYLSMTTETDIKQQSGRCLTRSPSLADVRLDLFVSNEDTSELAFSDISKKVESPMIGLSVAQPFYALDDALLRAKELAGTYLPTVTVKVYIHLFRGTHYAVERRLGLQMKEKKDTEPRSSLPYYQRTQYLSGDNLNYSLSIMPLECFLDVDKIFGDDTSRCFKSALSKTDTVTIINKRREKFRIDVPVLLTLQNIVIDSIDSVLHTQDAGIDLPACLNEYRRCCELNSSNTGIQNSLQDAQLTDSFSCSQSFDTLFTTMETDCFANWPRSLFKMRLTDENADISSPNELVLTNVSIKNIFYAMNSLVSFSNAGGTVRFSGSQFDHLHTCGAVVKDSYNDLGTPVLRKFVDSDCLNDDKISKIEDIRTYQALYGGKTTLQYYMDTVTDSTLQKVQLKCKLVTQNCLVLVTQETSFTDIPFGRAVYSSLQLINQQNGLKNLGYIVTLDKGVSSSSSLQISTTTFTRIKAPYNGCASQDSLIVTDAQITAKSWCQMKNFRKLFNPHGDFNSVQVAGPIVIRQHAGPIVIRDSQFVDSISYLGAISIEQIQGAFWLQKVTFVNNAALHGANALNLRMGNNNKEIDSDALIVGIKKQCGGINIQENSFTSNLGCENTTGAILMQCVASSGWNFDSTLDSYSFKKEKPMSFYDDLSTEQLSIEGKQLAANQVHINDNAFQANYAGTDTSVIEIQGFKNVKYSANVHSLNENFITNTFLQLSLMKNLMKDFYKNAIFIDPADVLTRAKSIVHIRGLESLDATKNVYMNNYVIDCFSPYASADAIQSNGILLTDLTGSVDFEGSSFIGNVGIGQFNRAGIKAPLGFCSKLIAFHRCKLKSLNMNNTTFQDNEAVQRAESETQQLAQLFSLDQSLFQSETLRVVIADLKILTNIFYNTNSMVTFQLQDLKLENLSLRSNEGASVILFQYLNADAEVYLDKPSIFNNKINKGAALKMEEVSGFKVPKQKSSQSHLKIVGGTFESNKVMLVDDSAKTSCIDFSGTSDSWASIWIGSTKFDNNQGVITNEIYVDRSVISLELSRVTWTSSVKQTSQTKMAQVIYRPRQANFELKVTNSKFTCTDVPFKAQVIMLNDISGAQGRASLFRLGQAENIKVLPILDVDEQSTLIDGQLSPDDFILKFASNSYVGCNQMDKGAIFYLEEGARLTEMKSVYEDCSALSGGLAYITGHGTYLHLQTPSKAVKRLQAYQGGIFYVEKGATVEMASYQGSSGININYCQAYEGTIAYAHDRARIIADDTLDLTQNKVYKRGLFIVTDGSQIYLKDSKIYANTIGLDSAIVHFENNRIEYQLLDGVWTPRDPAVNTILKSWLIDSEFSNNKIVKQGRILTVIDSNITVSNVNFSNNDATTVNYGIYVSYGELTLVDSNFIGIDDGFLMTDIYKVEYQDVSGAFLQVQEQSNVLVSNTKFQGGRGVYGGCILLQGYSRMEIEGCDFSRCSALYGGAIYANSHLSLVISKSTFDYNFSYIGYGQNIYSTQAQETLQIIDSSFRSYHNSIYTSGFSFDISNCKFSGLTEGGEAIKSYSKDIMFRSDGGGVYIEQTAKVTIKSTIFSDLKARYGGALYISQDRLSSDSLYKSFGFQSTRLYSLKNVTFENCNAEFDGGAVWVKNPLKMEVDTALFKGNKAKREGGAIDFVCEPSPLEVKLYFEAPCSLKLIGKIHFNSNSAVVGGAIRWNLMEMEVAGKPKFTKAPGGIGNSTFGTLTFEGNTAADYGPEIASVARELIKFGKEKTDGEKTYLKYFNGTVEERQQLVPEADRSSFFNNYIYTDVQSGGDVPTIYLGLIDKYGQLVTINRGSLIDFHLQDSSTEASKSEEFRTEITGVTNFFSAYGTYKMSGMGLITAPGNDIRVDLIVYAIDLTVPSNRAYLTTQVGLGQKITISSSNYSLAMSMQVRDCILGEGLKKSGACYECPKDTYLLEAPKVPTECRVCPIDKAICGGGKKVGPRPGFWRQTNTTYNFWPCPSPNNCKGMDENLPYDFPGNANGLCEIDKGYYGVMCTACKPGFKREGLTDCKECSKQEIVNTSLLVGAMLIVIIIVVNTTIKGAVQDSESSVFNKVLMNHFQMLIITADFDMNWPETVKSIFFIGAPINYLTEAIVNFDCFMDTRTLEEVDPYNFSVPNNEIRVYSMKVFLMAGMPILIGAFSYIIWWIICRCQRTMETMQQKFIATFIFLLFLIHPALTKRMVDVFNCRDYDGVSRLVADYQVKCYADERHFQLAFYCAVPCLFLWGLGIPAILYTMMTKNKDKLSTVSVKQQFGFLFNGYKRHNYYWEIVIMYRKVFCIFVAVFLRPEGVIVQALVLLVMLGIFMQVNNLSRPFKQRQLNDIENMSIVTQIVTIYCGIFFISAKEKNENFDIQKDFELTEAGQLILVMVIVTCNAFFLILWIIHFMEVGREVIKKFSKRIYVFIFLCGREDKLEKEAIRRAGILKREKIISIIDEQMLFLKKMKGIYSNNIFYEDHDRFLRLLYQVENEQRLLDLTEKRNNYYVQGPKARHRKFDRERIKDQQNEFSLEVEDNVVEVMENQREQGEGLLTIPLGTETGRIRETPFLDSLQRIRTSKKQKGGGDKAAAQLAIFKAMSLSQNKIHMQEVSFNGSEGGKILQLRPALIKDAESTFLEAEGDAPPVVNMLQTPNSSPPMGSSPAPANALGNALKQQIYQMMNNDLIFNEDEYQEQDSPSPLKEKKQATVVAVPKKKKKKTNQQDLDAVRDKSRNAKTNLIKTDKKNVTVGKIYHRKDNVETSVNRKTAETLKLQFNSVQEKRIGKLGMPSQRDELLEPSHVMEFAEVETLDSQEQKLHIMRQLSDRRDEPAATIVMPGAQKSLIDSASNIDNGSERRGSIGSQMMGSVMGAGSPEQMREDGQILPGEGDEKGGDLLEPPQKEILHKDMSPAAQLRAKELENPANEQTEYRKLRPRNFPRRQLQGDAVVDVYLDHSDSFRTVIQEGDEEDPLTIDKSGGEPVESISAAIDVGGDSNFTPRKEIIPLESQLELQFEPRNKFNIQMSPGKDPKDQSLIELQENPKGKQKEKLKVLDHDQLQIPLLDNLLPNGGIKLPRYRPLIGATIMTEDEMLSVERPIEGNEEELKVYDGSKTYSSLNTDPSMRDYDYMIEPDQFNFYLPPSKRGDSQDIGEGLGAVGGNFKDQFKNASLLHDHSQDYSQKSGSAPDKGISDFIGGGVLNDDQIIVDDIFENESGEEVGNKTENVKGNQPRLKKSKRTGFAAK